MEINRYIGILVLDGGWLVISKCHVKVKVYKSYF